MAVKIGTRGGLRLEAHKERSTRQNLRAASQPPIVVLPLDQHTGLPAIAIVKAGDRVLRGQPIAQPSGSLSAWLHSPVSGHVKAIEPRPAPHHLGSPTISVVIENDGRDEPFDFPARATFGELSPEELCEHIGRGGIVGLGGAVFPTAPKLWSGMQAHGPHLILNGVECEPYISCDDMLMRERASDVVFGARVLLHALSAKSCIIAVEDDMPLALEAMRRAVAEAGDSRVRAQAVPGIYPAGGEKQLISTLLGVEVPFDGLPADVGVLCHNVATAAAIAHWIRDGRPLISRIVTVTGDGVREPANLDVLLGTSFASVIADCGGYTERMERLIMGGSMMGLALPHDELPVVKATNCIVAASRLDLEPRAAEMPCIRCGLCADACPAFLLPQQIHLHVQSGDLAGMARYGLLDCIECGCCDYVCPSQIPLVERFREAKPLHAATLAERNDAALARLRFEARAERLERLESERRAALARKRQELTGKRP